MSGNPVIDMKGQRFSRLLVLDYVGQSAARSAMWRCRCDCGSIVTVLGSNLRAGHAKSCGCLRARMAWLDARRGTHHLTGTPTYSSWRAMLNRCGSPKHSAYPRYGGRGITVCDRWRSFENFLSDMGSRPSGKTLDRIDNDLGYGPGNCRWATAKEQQANRRVSRRMGGTP